MNRMEIEGYGARSKAGVRNLSVNPFLPEMEQITSNVKRDILPPRVNKQRATQ